jgi:hypothetical protein
MDAGFKVTDSNGQALCTVTPISAMLKPLRG